MCIYINRIQSEFGVIHFSPPLNHLAMKSAAKASLNDMEQLAYQMSSYAGLKSEVDSRLVSCHAVVVEDKLCTRINTVPAYMDINRLVCVYFVYVLLHSLVAIPRQVIMSEANALILMSVSYTVCECVLPSHMHSCTHTHTHTISCPIT